MSFLTFGSVTEDEITTAALMARAAYQGQPLPGGGWTPLTGADLGFTDSTLGGSFDGIYFNSGIGFFNAASAVVFQKGKSLAIAFRGTDSGADYLTYPDILGNDNYINAYDALLNSIAIYAKSHDITKIVVTGHSLGGAAANILRDISSSRYDKVFSSADYITFATAKVADDQNILNIGFENDIVFKVTDLYSDYSSTSDNLIWYGDQVSTLRNTDPHAINNYIEAISRIQQSQFYGSMDRDSNVVIVATDKQGNCSTALKHRCAA